MKVIIQRVKEAKVEIEHKVVGAIEHGFLLYVCFEDGDQSEAIDKAITKIVNLRIFEDGDHRMNHNIQQANGSILSISQFTLSWDGKKGHRPSFDRSMAPNSAKLFYRKFNDKLEELGIPLAKGQFGAEMKVHSINDGPVTFFLSF